MRCTLVDGLTITTASRAKADLLQAMSGSGAFEVDTTGVHDVDGAGLQVLLAAFKSAVSAKIPVVFPPDARGTAVTACLDLLGLSSCDWNHEDWIHGQEDTRG